MAFQKSEAELNGFDEALVLTPDGHASEASAANLFMVRDGVADHAARVRRHPRGRHPQGDARSWPRDAGHPDRGPLDRPLRALRRATRSSCAGRASRSARSSRSTTARSGPARSGRSARGISEPLLRRRARATTRAYRDWLTRDRAEAAGLGSERFGPRGLRSADGVDRLVGVPVPVRDDDVHAHRRVGGRGRRSRRTASRGT